MICGLVVLLIASVVNAQNTCSNEDCIRKPWCPEPWKKSQCLGSSGELGTDSVLATGNEKITWHAGMASHSHYSLISNRTALFVIDAQKVYSACPEGEPAVESLIADPSTENFDGHSPLCCEKFGSVITNINRIANHARSLGVPVFLHSHVYRDFDGDGEVDNCGRICDFDALGWTGWPMAWNLWNAAFPWHTNVYKTEEITKGFDANFETDYYAEKSTYSALTKPVLKKLKLLGVDTIVITGFMAQFCSVTTSRHAHDLGFRVVYVNDANDGPQLLQLLSGVDENEFIPFSLGIAVADISSTDEVIENMKTAFTG